MAVSFLRLFNNCRPWESSFVLLVLFVFFLLPRQKKLFDTVEETGHVPGSAAAEVGTLITQTLTGCSCVLTNSSQVLQELNGKKICSNSNLCPINTFCK